MSKKEFEKKKTKKKPELTWLTWKTHDPNHEILHRKKNHEIQFSINLILNDELERKKLKK